MYQVVHDRIYNGKANGGTWGAFPVRYNYTLGRSRPDPERADPVHKAYGRNQSTFEPFIH